METLFCHTEIEVNKICFLRFCTKYPTRFSKYGIALLVALSSTNATKTGRCGGSWFHKHILHILI